MPSKVFIAPLQDCTKHLKIRDISGVGIHWDRKTAARAFGPPVLRMGHCFHLRNILAVEENTAERWSLSGRLETDKRERERERREGGREGGGRGGCSFLARSRLSITLGRGHFSPSEGSDHCLYIEVPTIDIIAALRLCP